MEFSNKWKIGIVSQITPFSLIVEGHVNEFRDRIFDASPHHFASVNQFVYTFYGRYCIHVFKVVDISHSEKPYGKAETDKVNEFIRFKAVPFGTKVRDGFTLGVRDYPMVGDFVYAATEELLTDIFASTGVGIMLGNLVGFSNVRAQIPVDSLFSGHTGIFGNTGSGKSTTTRHILNEVVTLFDSGTTLDSKSRVVVIDIHGDYSVPCMTRSQNVTVIEPENVCLDPMDLSVEDWFAALLPSEGVQRPLLERALRYACLPEDRRKLLYAAFAYNALFSSSHESHASRKIQISKFLNLISEDIVISGTFKVSGRDLQVEDTSEFLQRVFILDYGNMPADAFETLQRNLKDYLAEFFDDDKPDIEKIIQVSDDASEFKTLKQLDEALDLVFCEEEVLGNRQARRYSQGLVTRLKNLVSKHDNSLVTAKTQSLFSRIEECKGVVIVDVQHISDDEGLALITNSLARKILNGQQTKARIGSTISPVALVLDEAHRYIRDDRDNPDSIFDRIAREGRKFGTYLFFVSQIPSELSPVVIGQATAFLLHRIQNSYDLEFLRRNLPAVSEFEISKLPLYASGQVLVTGAAIRTPMEVVIPGKFKDITPSVSFMQ